MRIGLTVCAALAGLFGLVHVAVIVYAVAHGIWGQVGISAAFTVLFGTAAIHFLDVARG